MLKKVIKTLREEMVPAQGCTEPIALALAAAIAAKEMETKPTKLHYKLSGNIIKNVDGVIVPNSGGLIGIEPCGLLGAYFGDSNKDLLVIANINENQIKKMHEKYYNRGIVTFERANVAEKLYIELIAKNDKDEVVVEIVHTHNNIVKILKNGKKINTASANWGAEPPLSDRTYLSIENIWNFSITTKIEGELKDKLDEAIKLNRAISNEGLENDWGIAVGRSTKKAIKLGLASDDIRTMVPATTAAGSDARMSGCAKAVLSISGSGNQGMTCIISVLEYAKRKNVSEEKTYRALLMSILSTIHIKTNIGRLSPFCGVVVAGAACGAAFAYLENLKLEDAKNTIIFTLADLSGLLCDGAKMTCASKIQTSVTSAIDSLSMVMNGKTLPEIGFLGKNVEETIKMIAYLANEGLTKADEAIFKIMIDRAKANKNI